MILDSALVRDVSDLYYADDESESSSVENRRCEIITPAFDMNASQFFLELRDGISPDLAMKLGSQGFLATQDGSAAFCHESTYSPADTRYNDDVSLVKGRNMDSGACLQRFTDRTNAACIADGVSGDGLAGAFAAHSFTTALIDMLAAEHVSFSDDKEANKDVVKKLFMRVAEKAASDLRFCVEKKCGSAPTGFVDCERILDAKKVRVVCGALGDVVIYHFSQSTKQVRQINTITRDLGPNNKPRMSDPGGYISNNGYLYYPGRISAETVEIDEDDLMILATDGVHDNLCSERAVDIVSFILQNGFFDGPYETIAAYPRPWEKQAEPDVPRLAQLRDFVQAHHVEKAQGKLSASQSTIRLINYIKLVNHTGFTYEEALHAMLLERRNVSPENGEKRMELLKKISDLKENNKGPSVGKPDDCMVITIAPTNSGWET